MSRPNFDTPFILLLFLGLTSGSGCQMLSIPSYRAESHGFNECCTAGALAAQEQSLGSGDCPPSILPPLPHWTEPCWLTQWLKHDDLPQPAPYPRFHPLPSRPMFSPAQHRLPYEDGFTGMPAPASPYGQLPHPSPQSAPNIGWQEAELVTPQPASNVVPPAA